MFSQVIAQVRRVVQSGLQVIQQKISGWAKPNTITVAIGSLADMARTKPELIAEIAFLRQQQIVLQRSVKRPKLTTGDRWLLVSLASRLRQWQQALLIIQPETVLHWHRDWFTWLWRRKSQAKASHKQILDSTVALIKQMLRENRLWGAEQVRGELLKLGLRVSKRTIQRYKREVRPTPTGRQTWRTFVHNHGQDIWRVTFSRYMTCCCGVCSAFSWLSWGREKSFMWA